MSAALGLVINPDQRNTDRRSNLRRRDDAHSVAEMLAAVQRDENVKTFALGGSRARRSALYDCGCVIVDPVGLDDRLHLLQCPEHAALQMKLRRRQTDRG